MGVHFIRTVLKLNTAFQSTTFNFKMKVLVVCLVGAALVGMGASTSLEKVEGETGALTSLVKVNWPPRTTAKPTTTAKPSTTANVVEGEEHGSMDLEVLGEGPGAEGICKYAGHVADSHRCSCTHFYGVRCPC